MIEQLDGSAHRPVLKGGIPSCLNEGMIGRLDGGKLLGMDFEDSMAAAKV
jgi:hypothetical protein